MGTGTATTEAPVRPPLTSWLFDPPAPGSVFLGKYRVTRVLGEGGMSVVLEAVHLELEQDVAIKLLASHSGREAEMLARFRNEARVTARLPAEHVVRALDAGLTEGGQPYLVLELLAGRDLDAELEARARLPVTEAIDYVLQACEGLAEAHAIQLVHRDLKPANLFLSRRRDGSPLVKVVDFGIASCLPGAEIPVENEGLCGTPLYMAPEQFNGGAVIDPRADQYALATVLFELIAGEAPFAADDVQRIALKAMTEPAPRLSSRAPGAPRGLDAAIARALAKKPEERFPDLAAFAEAIAPFGPGNAKESADRVRAVLDVGPATAGPRRASERRARRSTRIASAIAAAATLLAAALAIRPMIASADVPIAAAALRTPRLSAPSASVATPVPGRAANELFEPRREVRAEASESLPTSVVAATKPMFEKEKHVVERRVPEASLSRSTSVSPSPRNVFGSRR